MCAVKKRGCSLAAIPGGRKRGAEALAQDDVRPRKVSKTVNTSSAPARRSSDRRRTVQHTLMPVLQG
uniref:Uncharacterized protein n=1 Tax=Moniliophthora roreri TaxID=221103 RepID=A0A0W0FT87_MONRR